MFKKRKKEINARKKELLTSLAAPDADIDAIEQETTELNTELADIERREKAMEHLADNPDDGNPQDPNNPANERQFTRSNVLSSKEYRSAFAKTLMHLRLDETEQRALDVAMTTTDTTYAAASESADGINNGGLFIPTDINLALMERVSLVSPIFRDMSKLAVPGVLSFPYKKSKSAAKTYGKGKETTPNTDGQIEFAELKLSEIEISETIRVSWKLEKMSVDSFISYLTDEIVDSVQDSLVTNGIYGSTSDEMKGVVTGSIKGTYTGSAMEAIPEALGKLPKKCKIGAKIYVSQSIIEEISFEKDSNGNYIYNPINSAGIKSIATYVVEADPYLNDGDFVIGNLGRYYKLNVVESCSVSVDRSGKKRANDYTAYMIAAGNVQPETVVSYSKTKAKAS